MDLDYYLGCSDVNNFEHWTAYNSSCNVLDMKTLAERLSSRMAAVGLTQDRLADMAKVSQTTIYKLTSGKAQESRKLVAIAEALGVSPKWLSTGEGPILNSGSASSHIVQRPDPSLVSIPQFDAGGRMGNGGLILQDQPGTIQRWEVSRQWLNQNVKGVSSASQLCIVTGFGDSMKPMFNPGDPLLVDLSVKTVDYDAVYFFRVGDEGFIKRIQRIPGQGLKAISANRDHYEPWTISDDMDFEVLGRVLKVWKGDDF